MTAAYTSIIRVKECMSSTKIYPLCSLLIHSGECMEPCICSLCVNRHAFINSTGIRHICNTKLLLNIERQVDIIRVRKYKNKFSLAREQQTTSSHAAKRDHNDLEIPRNRYPCPLRDVSCAEMDEIEHLSALTLYSLGRAHSSTRFEIEFHFH